MAQHDYVIDNSTGANVRADINSVLQAIASNNSGSSAPSTTYAFQLFADTTNNVMKIRNAANNAFIELFQLDGTFTLEDGSASTPALAFRDDLNTGIFSSAADTFNVATGGVERMELGTTTVFNEDGADVDFRIEGDTEANLFYVDAGNNRIGIGTTATNEKLNIHTASSSKAQMQFTNTTTGTSAGDGFVLGIDGSEEPIIWNQENTNMKFATNNTERMRIDSSGRVKIGTTSNTPASSNVAGIVFGDNTAGTATAGVASFCADGSAPLLLTRRVSDGNVLGIADDTTTLGFLRVNSNDFEIRSTNNMRFQTGGGTERMRIDSSGNVAIGTTSAAQKLHIDGGSNDPFLLLQRSGAGDSAVDIGGMQMKNSTNVLADIRCRSSDINDGFLKFSAMKAGTLTERQRFSANTASVYIGRVGGEVSVASDDRTFSEGIGVTLAGGGEGGGSYNVFTADNTTTMYIGRQFSDGQLIQFRQAGSEEGNIAVSGSTVSYNGGHLSRWSQLSGISSTDKSARPTIYQGTVMSNLDELCSWSHSDVLYTEEDEKNDDIPDGKKVGDIRRAAYTEDNQQLNMTKVSDIEGDKDVAGVFWAWDDDDDEIVNDFYVAMTGDMVIRVAASTTVARGDLLISAGDGTAKPQADDIVRSSTIAKIISTNHTATYPDGSKAYPCVLMAC